MASRGTHRRTSKHSNTDVFKKFDPSPGSTNASNPTNIVPKKVRTLFIERVKLFLLSSDN